MSWVGEFKFSPLAQYHTSFRKLNRIFLQFLSLQMLNLFEIQFLMSFVFDLLMRYQLRFCLTSWNQLDWNCSFLFHLQQLGGSCQDFSEKKGRVEERWIFQISLIRLSKQSTLICCILKLLLKGVENHQRLHSNNLNRIFLSSLFLKIKLRRSREEILDTLNHEHN